MNLSFARKTLLLAIIATSVVTHARGQALYSYQVAPNTQNTGEQAGSTSASPNLLAQSQAGALVTASYYTFAGFNDAYGLYGGGNNPTSGGAGGTLTYATPSYTTANFTAASYSNLAGTAPTYVTGNNPSAWAPNNTGSMKDAEWLAETPNQNNTVPTSTTAPGNPAGNYSYIYSFTMGGVAGTQYTMNISGTVFADNGITVQIIGSGAPVNGGSNAPILLAVGTNAANSNAGDTGATGSIGANNRANQNNTNTGADLSGTAMNYNLTLQGGGTYILVYTVSNIFSTAQALNNQFSENSTGFAVSNFDIQYVPEPTTYAAWLMAGVLAIAVIRRITRKRAIAVLA
jgi:hypothetical protein